MEPISTRRVMTVYARPGTDGAKVSFASRYDNYIGGTWVPPVKGEYFENPTPVTGEVFCEVARSTAEDVELALDAAHKAAPAWGKTSVAERAVILNKIADRIEENLETLAVAETWDNGKAIREPLNADLPLAIDHFRYFAGAIRAQEGTLSQIDDDTVAYHFHEPLGVVGQIIPWNFPLLMATWKLAPALAAGNCGRAQAGRADARPRSWSSSTSSGTCCPTGVLNIINGFGAEAGKPLASNRRIAKIAFTGRDHDRPPDHAVRLAEPDPRDARAGRQEPEHLLRRHREREGRLLLEGPRGLHDVRPEPGRGLHVPVARPDAGRHL
jgi:aldehyde dehydrogenase